MATLALVACSHTLAAQAGACSPGLPELRALEFTGNHALARSTLADAIEVKPSSWLRRTTRRIGERRCLAPGALTRDVARIMLLYRRRGYPGVRVDTIVQRPRPDARVVRFVIAEGPPVRVDSVTIVGVDDDASRRRLAEQVTLRPGDVLDLAELEASRAAVERRLRREGNLAARIQASTLVDPVALRGVGVITVEPGPRVRLGAIHVDAFGRRGDAPRVTDAEVRRLTALHPGEVLGSQRIEAARRNLLDAGLYERVAVGIDSVRGGADGDALADVRIAAVERHANEVRLRGGYGTMDCMRLQVDVSRSAFLSPPGSLEITGRLSKVGIGEPLDFAREVCSEAIQEDPYSQWLNYYAGVTYRHPALGPRGISRALAVYSERRSEYLAYLRTTYAGVSTSLTRTLGGRWTGKLGYDLNYGSTEAQPAVLCATFSACLPEERERAGEPARTGVLSAVTSRDRTDDPLDPTRGDVLRLEVRVAPHWLGTSTHQQFAGARLDASYFRGIGRRAVLAGRLRAGIVTGVAGADFIPPEERLYAGGATTVRGVSQNGVGPQVYVVDSVNAELAGTDTVFRSTPEQNEWRSAPPGGNSLVVANLEIRARPPVLTSLLQFVVFVDAGAVWSPDAVDDFLGFHQVIVTPGIGVRAFTPIGPVRLDVGYSGTRSPAGPAYRDVAIGFSTAPLYCVSPGNTLPVTGTGQVDAEGLPIPPVQEDGPCPATFQPARAEGFVDRLTFHLSIGQAF
jgi:outer membrane protein insertion porin family/translocation and assembly module TamA